MWLALCDAADSHGVWAVEQLNLGGFPHIELVTTQALLVGSRWTLVSSGSSTSSRLVLADGREIGSSAVEGVLNRIAVIPSPVQSGIRPEDEAYAVQELSALLLAWLDSLRNVLNPAHPSGLCGQIRSTAEWTSLAARAGLATLTYERRVLAFRAPRDPLNVVDTAKVFVFGHAAVGDPAAAGLEASCQVLAAMAGTPLLEVSFVKLGSPYEDRWLFAGASALPELERAGERGIELLSAALLNNPAIR